MQQTEDRKISVRLRKGMALALSGGGYRAMLFHLGLLRRLNELDLLKSISAVSSVSGGSIAAAQLAKTAKQWKKRKLNNEEWNALIRDPLFNLCSNNIRTQPILSSIVMFWKKGVAVLETEKYYQKLLTRQTLGELPDNVDFIFCSSDMVFSTHWYFRKQTSRDKRTGNHRAGRLKEWASIPVAKAVAASSCFPPLYGPMVLGSKADDFVKPSSRDENWENLVENIRLTDGGVYDNLGVDPVWDDYRILIVSDGGKPSPFTELGKSGQIMRLPNLFQQQVENLRKRMLFERTNSKALDFNATLVAIDGGGKENGYTTSFAKDIVSTIRTDLDSFSDTEKRVLENHGYALADANLKEYILSGLDSIAYDQKAVDNPVIPNPEYLDECDLRIKMKKSSKRSLFYKWRIL